jgi:hypothetical protein
MRNLYTSPFEYYYIYRKKKLWVSNDAPYLRHIMFSCFDIFYFPSHYIRQNWTKILYIYFFTCLIPKLIRHRCCSGYFRDVISWYVHWRHCAFFLSFELWRALKVELITWGNLVQHLMAEWQALCTTDVPVIRRRANGNRDETPTIKQWSVLREKKNVNRIWTDTPRNQRHQLDYKPAIPNTDLLAATLNYIMDIP